MRIDMPNFNKFSSNINDSYKALRNKIETFNLSASSGESSSIEFSSEEINILNSWCYWEFETIVSNFPMSNKFSLGFTFYELHSDFVKEIFTGWPIGLIPFLKIKVVKDLYFEKGSDGNGLYQISVLRYLNYASVPKFGLPDETAPIQKNRSFLIFLLGSEIMQNVAVKFQQPGFYENSLEERLSANRKIKPVIENIKTISVENKRIVLET